MVGSYGTDASVVASWVDWIKTLTSVLVFSLDGIISLAGALSWSYGLWWFKEVRNGVRGFVCVILVRGLSSLDEWSWGSLGIFVTSLGFAKCFCKPFCTLEAILQPFRSLENHLATKWEFRSPFLKLGAFRSGGGFHGGGEFSQQMEDLAGGSYGAAKSFRSQREFRSPFWSLEIIL